MNSEVAEENFLEKAFLDTFCNFPKADYQLNKMHEADAEIISIGGSRFAVTTDTIVEEIEYGMYRDGFTIGWMSVVINLSDLAAVGASPVGLLLNQTFKKTWDEDFIAKIREGILRACQEHGTHVLGGDTNFSGVANMGATALGQVDTSPISRIGCSPGDLLFATGKLGGGNAYGFTAIHGENVNSFMPKARIREGKIIARYASGCIDSSDGFVHSLCTLGNLNHVGFSVTSFLKDVVCESALDVAFHSGTPPFLFLAGILGEYELICTIPREKCATFIEDFKRNGFEAVLLGEVQTEEGLHISTENDRKITFSFDDFLKINHSFHHPEKYIEQLLLLGRETV